MSALMPSVVAAFALILICVTVTYADYAAGKSR